MSNVSKADCIGWLEQCASFTRIDRARIGEGFLGREIEADWTEWKFVSLYGDEILVCADTLEEAVKYARTCLVLDG